MPALPRRNFLKASAVAGAAVTLGKLALRITHAAEVLYSNTPGPSWVNRPMRWAQLTLVEDDPGK